MAIDRKAFEEELRRVERILENVRKAARAKRPDLTAEFERAAEALERLAALIKRAREEVGGK